MGWTVRASVGMVAVTLAVACGPRRPPAGIAPRPEPFTLEGTWWLLDSTDGPVRARLVFDKGDMHLFPAGTTAEHDGWSVVKHRGTWEAHGPNDAVLWMKPRGDNQLVAWTSDGRLGLGYRLTPLPARLAGRWLVRDPRWSSIMSWTVVPGPAGKPGRLLEADGETQQLWPIRRAVGEWSVIARRGSGAVELMHLAKGPLDTWFTWTEAGQYRAMYRPGERPFWLPVQGVMGDGAPTRPPPSGTVGQVPDAAKDMDVPVSMLRTTFTEMQEQLKNMAESDGRSLVSAAVDGALGRTIIGESVYADYDLLERRFQRMSTDGLLTTDEAAAIVELIELVAPTVE
ncbi:MAG: hypothetical protein ACI9MC_001006 [Kiritimatiellia bacterium]|jgi:hypothetical protein